LAALFLTFFGRSRRFLAATLSTAGIGLYTLLVGAGPAVVYADPGGLPDLETLQTIQNYNLFAYRPQWLD